MSEKGPDVERHRHTPLMPPIVYSKGYVIRHVVQPGAAGEVVFLSEASASAPRYHLSYQPPQDGLLNGRFEVAPTGTPDALAPYICRGSRGRSGRRTHSHLSATIGSTRVARRAGM